MGSVQLSTDPSGDQRFTVGPLSLVITSATDWRDGLARLQAEIEKNPKLLHDNDELARAEVERILREMHTALAERFAPVLRWRPCGNGSAASLGPWELFARARFWSLRYCERADWCITLRTAPRRYAGDEAESRADAESALRAAHVPFRVEADR